MDDEKRYNPCKKPVDPSLPEEVSQGARLITHTIKSHQVVKLFWVKSHLSFDPFS